MVEKKKRRKMYSHDKRALFVGAFIFLAFFFLAGNFSFGATGNAITGFDTYNVNGDILVCNFNKVCGGTETDNCGDCGGQYTSAPAGAQKVSDTSASIRNNPRDGSQTIEGDQGWLPDVFNFWTDYGAETSFVRYLVFILLFMIVYWTISGIFSTDENEGKPSKMLVLGYIAFSAIVAFLSINFILTDELIALMVPYSALGATLIVMIPFIVVLLFTAKMVTMKYLSTHRVLIQRAVWGAYALFVLYYLLTLGTSANTFITLIIGGIGILSFLIFIFNKGYIRWIRKLKRDIKDANSKARIEEEKREALEAHHQTELRKVLRERSKYKKESEALQDQMQEFLDYDLHKGYI